MKEWFENKTVAIIGNAMSLFDKQYGIEIDEHDVVVRLNKAAMLHTNFDVSISHGKRTDVWIFWNAGEYKKLFSELPNVKKMHAGHQGRYESNVSAVDFLYPISPNYNNLKLKAGEHNNPTTGFIALDWITSCNPLKLDIYGFDWKETPTFTDPNRVKDKTCLHDHKTEKEYVNSNILTLPYVILKN